MTENKIPVLSEVMAKLLDRIYSDLMSTLVELSGNLTDIECGTHIKIPMGAGYVNFYRSQVAYEITCWMKESIQEMTKSDLRGYTTLNLSDEK